MYEELLQKGRDIVRRLGTPSPENPANDPHEARRTLGVLFGDVWSDDRHLALEERSLITLAVLMTLGGMDEQLGHHVRAARKLGISREKIEALTTHLNFYAGFPKGGAARRIARRVFAEENGPKP